MKLLYFFQHLKLKKTKYPYFFGFGPSAKIGPYLDSEKGRVGGWGVGLAENKASSAPIELGRGLSLAKKDQDVFFQTVTGYCSEIFKILRSSFLQTPPTL